MDRVDSKYYLDGAAVIYAIDKDEHIRSLSDAEIEAEFAKYLAALYPGAELPITIPDGFPDISLETAEDFYKDHPSGTFVLGFGNHVATVVDGDLYDSWDSSKEIPQYFWHKGDNK